MARDRKLMKEQHAFITDVYNQLSKTGKRHKEICKILKEEYHQFIKPRTIYAIVSGEYDLREMKFDPSENNFEVREAYYE